MHFPPSNQATVSTRQMQRLSVFQAVIKCIAETAKSQKLKYNNILAHNESCQMTEFSCTTAEQT